MRLKLFASLSFLFFLNLSLFSQQKYIADQIIVKISADEFPNFSPKSKNGVLETGISTIDELNRKYQINSIEPFLKFKPKDTELDKEFGLSRIFVFNFPSFLNPKFISNEFSKLDVVESAEPNYVYSTTSYPNDPNYQKQWAHENRGQVIPLGGGAPVGTPGVDIETRKAWTITIGSRDLILAILDTGLDYHHPEFAGRIIPGYDFKYGDDDPMDDDGHGTVMFGIAAATGNNNIGMAGVDWNCRLLPVKVIGKGTGSEQSVSNGVIFAADSGAKVISMSWGSTTNSGYLKSAIDYAYAKGCVLFGSRGNWNDTASFYPASYTNVMAVGALSPCDGRKTFSTCDGENWASNYGIDLDFLAPGTRIFSTDMIGQLGYSPNEYFQFANGTSAATPHAAGVAALILSLNPFLSQDSIRNLMRYSCIDLGSDGFDLETGYGRLNAFRTVKNISKQKLFAGPNKIIFSETEVGTTKDLYLDFYNNTDASRSISLNFSDSGYAADRNNFTVLKDRFEIVKIQFHPTRTGKFTSILSCNAGDTTIIILIEGNAVYYPKVSLSSSSLHFNLNNTDSTKTSLIINNSGLADLSWKLNGVNFENSFTRSYPEHYYTKLKRKGEPDTRVGIRQTEKSGGIDKFGYWWITNEHSKGPSYSFTDISTTGTKINLLQVNSNLPAKDEGFGIIDLPFDFIFYGFTFNKTVVSSNGFITFNFYFFEESSINYPIPSFNRPDAIISPFWTDLDGTKKGDIYYQQIDDKFIIQWNNWDYWPSSNGDLTFQIILFSNSSKVQFVYSKINSTWNFETIGIENFDGNDGLEIAFNTSFIKNNLLLEIDLFLSSNPISGNILPMSSQPIFLTAKSKGLKSDVYHTEILLSTNDPNNIEIKIPATVSISTNISDKNDIPDKFVLYQNYPNPFNGVTSIVYLVPRKKHVLLKVYDVLGREVATLVDEIKDAGFYHFPFSILHYPLRSSVYFYQLKAGNRVETKKMVYLK
ncbi:MAG: T9SS type A sorting domain-containing protein [Ignavibacteria bacterium]|nr:T9SS type A sorting domain-containing protein [Ignavibacteria bacterium]